MSWIYHVNNEDRTITFHVEKISYEDMLKIMAEFVGYDLILTPKPTTFILNTDNSELFMCPCNPAKGGSGVCNCTAGTMQTYYRNDD